ncbi:methyltransferase domain-containing protein [Mangrovimicrobium sediminis]|uniref:Methyltransferase domain-containing protein n=1 Tax=Mangrovimicrobium sediminis TaxID=2562682 RepID=A0A4Z0M333_9GAMM|nr:methyltransferase domain-containing protein [Haliea sp. SAOS-164]TGD73866.1 methyltransferase domain-containing protein [Haliea sp. SAOS-164]
MTEPDHSADIAGARAYEALHVPALFAQWSPLILAATQVTPGQHVLDVACGTGVLARCAAGCVGQEGIVAGVDPGIGMLAVARDLAPQIDWREGSAESLPFDDASFDVVASQFGLMFFRDRERALREMRRVLRPGGRLAVAVWDQLDSAPAFAHTVALLDEMAGRAAGDALRAPFCLGDIDMLRELFAAAGMPGVEVQPHPGSACYPDIRSFMTAELHGWLPLMGVVLEDALAQAMIERAEQDLADYRDDEGRMVSEVSALLVTAP